MPLVMDDVKVATHEKEWKCTNTLACLNLGMASLGLGSERPPRPESCVGSTGSRAASRPCLQNPQGVATGPSALRDAPPLRLLNRLFLPGVTTQGTPPVSCWWFLTHPAGTLLYTRALPIGFFKTEETGQWPALRSAAPDPCVYSVLETIPSLQGEWPHSFELLSWCQNLHRRCSVSILAPFSPSAIVFKEEDLEVDLLSEGCCRTHRCPWQCSPGRQTVRSSRSPVGT